MEMLTNYPWKGNVRELANFIERAVIITRGQQLEVPLATLPTSSRKVVAVGSNSTFRQAESSVIIEALRAAAGTNCRQGGAAERLGLTYDAAKQDSPLGHRKSTDPVGIVGWNS